MSAFRQAASRPICRSFRPEPDPGYGLDRSTDVSPDRCTDRLLVEVRLVGRSSSAFGLTAPPNRVAERLERHHEDPDSLGVPIAALANAASGRHILSEFYSLGWHLCQLAPVSVAPVRLAYADLANFAKTAQSAKFALEAAPPLIRDYR